MHQRCKGCGGAIVYCRRITPYETVFPFLTEKCTTKEERSNKQRNKTPTTFLLPDSPLLCPFSKHVYTALISTILLMEKLHFFGGSIPHCFPSGKGSHLLIQAALQSATPIPVHFVCAILQLVQTWCHLLSNTTLKWEEKMWKTIELMLCWRACFKQTSEVLSTVISSASKG